MNDHTKQESRAKTIYSLLDKFLLYLMTAELGYFILLMLVGIALTILSYFNHSALDFLNKYHTVILWPVAPYILALPLNLFGGLASLALNIRASHEGYPGTGHLLNWIFIATTAWLFLLAIVFLLPGFARSY